MTITWTTGTSASDAVIIIHGGCSTWTLIAEEFRRAVEESDWRARARDESRALAVTQPVRRDCPPPALPRRAPWPVMRSFA